MSAAAVVLDEARSTTRRVARTFALACRMLPREVRDDVYLLYLFFRTLDDLVDEFDPDADKRVAAVEGWLDGAPVRATPETSLLADLSSRHELPRHALREFCRGMRSDLEAATFATEDDVDTYCYRVAGTVGVTMCSLLGLRGSPEEGVRAAAALGKAMQRTNILRDVDEDLERGRIYLAQSTLARFGCATLAPGPARVRVVRDGIARADALYDQGMAGIPLLAGGRRSVCAAAAMYREILRQIEREGCGVRAGRAVVPQRRKLAIAARRAALAR